MENFKLDTELGVTGKAPYPDAMVVEGAGVAESDATYLRDGLSESKPLYLRAGDSVGGARIAWGEISPGIFVWRIDDVGEVNLYRSFENVATPDLVANPWEIDPITGVAPAPTVRRATIEEYVEAVAATTAQGALAESAVQYSPQYRNPSARLAAQENVIGSELPYGRGQFGERRPVVVFLDDDGRNEVFTKIKPVVESRNIPVTLAAISNRVDVNAAYLTTEQLKTMESLGCEICAHSHNHPSLATLSEVDLIADLDACKSYMESNGFTSSKHFVYPFSSNNALVRSEVSKRWRDASITTGTRDSSHSSYLIPRVALGSFTSGGNNTLEFYKSVVDEAIADNKMVVFMLHVWDAAHDATQQQHWEDLIDYIQLNNVDILNITDALDIHGLRASEQPNQAGTDRFRVGPDSVVRDASLIAQDTFTNATPITSYPSKVMSRMFLTDAVVNGFPGTSAAGYLTTFRADGNEGGTSHQFYRSGGSNRTFTRIWNSIGTWGAWSELALANDQNMQKIYPTPRMEWWPEFGDVNVSNELTLANIYAAGLLESEPEFTPALWKRTAGAREIVRSGGGDGSSSAQGRFNKTFTSLPRWTVLVSARLLTPNVGSKLLVKFGSGLIRINSGGASSTIIGFDGSNVASVNTNLNSTSLVCFGISWDGTTIRGVGELGAVGTNTNGGALTSLSLSGTSFGIPGADCVHGPFRIYPFALRSTDLQHAVLHWSKTVNG